MALHLFYVKRQIIVQHFQKIRTLGGYVLRQIVRLASFVCLRFLFRPGKINAVGQYFGGSALNTIFIGIASNLKRSLDNCELSFFKMFTDKFRSASPSHNVYEICLPFLAGFNIASVNCQPKFCDSGIIRRMFQLGIGVPLKQYNSAF